ncbi:MAG: type II secretion system secretin GspD [Deltaproteobacteria bacterium]|nr:type II secretion system secretin GspD [Deltaproteobacteria bacterium]MBW2305976.1 type II secretion system secretin GspD [Deltaproteobacteria bacterium]
MMKFFSSVIGFTFFICMSVLPPAPDTTWGARVTSEEKVEAPSAPSAPPAKKPPGTTPSVAPETPAAPPGDELSPITMNFIDMDIRELIRLISERTGKNFIVDERVKGNVTVIAPKPISPEMAYRVFLSILEVHGYRVVPAGSVNKVVPALLARQRGVETFEGRVPMEVDGSDKIITQIIPLLYANVEQVKNLLVPLVSKESVVLSYRDNNMLVITDVASNIARLLKIIHEIDVEGLEERIHIQRLRYAVASEMANLINSLMSSAARTPTRSRTPTRGRTQTPPAPFRRAVQAAGPSETVKVLSDDRTNTLIILAGPRTGEMILDLISKLDVETPKGRGRIHVYYLNYANAEEMAQTLTQLPTQPAQQRTARAPVVASRTRVPQAAARTPLLSGVNITADKATNSLIITATPEDYDMLVSVIEKLDIPRLQVFIEALFVEISANERLDMGVEWSAFGNPTVDDYETVVGGSFISSSNLGSVLGAVGQGVQPSFPSGFALGVLGETFQFGDVTINSLAALVNLLKSMSNVDILSTPQILTMDNEEAKIIVSTNVPFTVRADVDATNIARTVRTFEYRDVGVTLNVTPSITKNKFIRLKLFQEVSSLVSAVSGGVASAELAPTTLKRQAETVVVVKDESTIVIGGLIGDQINTSESMAPCLGEIPYLGWLFRTTARQREKTNLLIFLTPHIIDTPEKVEAFYKKKHHLIMEEKTSKDTSLKLEESIPAPRESPPVNKTPSSDQPSAEQPPAHDDEPAGEGR